MEWERLVWKDLRVVGESYGAGCLGVLLGNTRVGWVYVVGAYVSYRGRVAGQLWHPVVGRWKERLMREHGGGGV